MEPQLVPLQFYTDGFLELGNRVPLRAAAEALAALATALESITSKLSQKGPAVSWVIQDTGAGSLIVDVEPQPLRAAGPYIADETVRVFATAVDANGRGEDIEELVPKAAATSIRRIAELVESGASRPIRIRRGDLEVTFRSSDVTEVLPDKFQSLGSIEGELTTVSFSGAPFFTIRTRLDSVSVRCALDADRFYDDVVSSLRQRVRVSGLVTKGRDGIPTSLSQVTSIYRFAPNIDLPQPLDIEGIDLDLTNGQPAEIWIRSGRDESG